MVKQNKNLISLLLVQLMLGSICAPYAAADHVHSRGAHGYADSATLRPAMSSNSGLGRQRQKDILAAIAGMSQTIDADDAGQAYQATHPEQVGSNDKLASNTSKNFPRDINISQLTKNTKSPRDLVDVDVYEDDQTGYPCVILHIDEREMLLVHNGAQQNVAQGAILDQPFILVDRGANTFCDMTDILAKKLVQTLVDKYDTRVRNKILDMWEQVIAAHNDPEIIAWFRDVDVKKPYGEVSINEIQQGIIKAFTEGDARIIKVIALIGNTREVARLLQSPVSTKKGAQDVVIQAQNAAFLRALELLPNLDHTILGVEVSKDDFSLPASDAFSALDWGKFCARLVQSSIAIAALAQDSGDSFERGHIEEVFPVERFHEILKEHGAGLRMRIRNENPIIIGEETNVVGDLSLEVQEDSSGKLRLVYGNKNQSIEIVSLQTVKKSDQKYSWFKTIVHREEKEGELVLQSICSRATVQQVQEKIKTAIVAPVDYEAIIAQLQLGQGGYLLQAGCANSGKGFFLTQLLEFIQDQNLKITKITRDTIDGYLIPRAERITLPGRSEASFWGDQHKEPLLSYDLKELYEQMYQLAQGKKGYFCVYDVGKRPQKTRLDISREEVIRMKQSGDTREIVLSETSKEDGYYELTGYSRDEARNLGYPAPYFVKISDYKRGKNFLDLYYRIDPEVSDIIALEGTVVLRHPFLSVLENVKKIYVYANLPTRMLFTMNTVMHGEDTFSIHETATDVADRVIANLERFIMLSRTEDHYYMWSAMMADIVVNNRISDEMIGNVAQLAAKYLDPAGKRKVLNFLSTKFLPYMEAYDYKDGEEERIIAHFKKALASNDKLASNHLDEIVFKRGADTIGADDIGADDIGVFTTAGIAHEIGATHLRHSREYGNLGLSTVHNDNLVLFDGEAVAQLLTMSGAENGLSAFITQARAKLYPDKVPVFVARTRDTEDLLKAYRVMLQETIMRRGLIIVRVDSEAASTYTDVTTHDSEGITVTGDNGMSVTISVHDVSRAATSVTDTVAYKHLIKQITTAQ